MPTVSTNNVPVNSLLYGNNLPMLRRYIPDECVDLHYLDPPFNSNRNYFVLFKDRTGKASEAQEAAFIDTWTWNEESEDAYRELQHDCPNQDLAVTIVALRRILKETPMMAYLVAMAIRLVELHRTLKPTGSLYLHCDPTASHYLKIVLDVIFGPQNFRNEITWKRTSAHNDAKQGRKAYGNIADTLLYYTKGNAYTFNTLHTAYSEDYLRSSYKNEDKDGRRWKSSDLTGPGGAAKGNPEYEFLGVKRYWRFSRENMERLLAEGRIHQSQPGMVPRMKHYLDEMLGIALQNIWDDVRPVIGSEALGYPTQKPVALLERVIGVSSNPGDIVMDSFCGCGTAVAAAQKLGRQWIGIDVTTVAVGIIKTRMEQAYPELMGKIPVIGFPVDLEGARSLFETDPYSFQEWASTLIGAYPLRKKGADGGIDGWLPFRDFDESSHRAVVQVKGGKVQVGQVRDFCHVVAREKATLGFFLCMGDEGRTITQPMKVEALKEGPWESAGGHCYPKVQILSIKDLLEGKAHPQFPPQDKRSLLGFKAAKQAKPTGQITADEMLFSGDTP